MNWKPEYKPAVTVMEITGRCIPTIPVGTRFEVVVNGTNPNAGYSACRGLCIDSIWDDEFRLITENEPATVSAS